MDHRREVKRTQEQDDNMTEIANNLFSDLLTENPDQAVSAFGPNRVVPDRWKGMSPEQIENIRKEQLRQMEEKKVRVEFDLALFIYFFNFLLCSLSFCF